MSLFSQLRRLDSSELEDFNTEIVAAVLAHSKPHALAWLRSEGLTAIVDPDEVSVTTQEELEALEDHVTGSRPDLAIRLTKNGQTELIYIESKIGSSEGASQLERYADHLEQARRYSRRTLIYLTRDYQPKEISRRTEVEFCQMRWADVYKFFNRLEINDSLTIEMLHFMKENNMDRSNQFTNIDILALTNFSKARKLMEQTMWEGVDQQFTAVCGKHSDQGDSFLQLRNKSRYTMYYDNKQRSCGILLGYWFNDETVTVSPTLGAWVEVRPKTKDRSEIVQVMRKFIKKKNGTWWDYDLNNETKWGGMSREKHLQEFISNPEDDHVKAIAAFFMDCLKDVQEFISNNADLIL